MFDNTPLLMQALLKVLLDVSQRASNVGSAVSDFNKAEPQISQGASFISGTLFPRLLSEIS